MHALQLISRSMPLGNNRAIMYKDLHCRITEKTKKKGNCDAYNISLYLNFLCLKMKTVFSINNTIIKQGVKDYSPANQAD